MTVESNYAIAISTLCDWFKNLVPVCQPMNRKTKTNRDLHARFFPRFEQVTWNCYEFGLVHCAICTCCDWSTQLKSALSVDNRQEIKSNKVSMIFDKTQVSSWRLPLTRC